MPNDLSTAKILSQNDAYTTYRLLFKRDGMSIFGAYFRPKNPQSPATVLLGHGFGATYRSLEDYATAFARAGIAAYAFDFCGGSPYSKSGGRMTDMSVLTERDDMASVLDGFLDSTIADSGNIFLLGESQGGFAAALLAAKRERDVRGLILLCPALVIPDHARAQFSSLSEIPKTVRQFGIKIGRRYYADVLELDPIAAICSYKKDVLLLHGDRDSVVPISYSQRAARAYPSVQLITIPGAGHGFYGAARDKAQKAAIEYVFSHTVAKPQ